MDVNPYQSPKADLAAPKANAKDPSYTRDDLRRIAACQKGIIVSIVIYVLVMPTQFLYPEFQMLPALGGFAVGLVGAAFGCLLAIKTCGTGVGIAFGLLSLIPCLGMVILYHLSKDAAVILKENGIKVGLLGARLSDI
ncbi:MAG: hypothetical protein ACYC35_26090 [Pirellulales bacterium]